jgi:hypothetical protein
MAMSTTTAVTHRVRAAFNGEAKLRRSFDTLEEGTRILRATVNFASSFVTHS